MKWLLPLLLALFVAGAFFGCVSTPPKNVNNLCQLFKEKPSWYRQTRKAAKRWNTTVPVIMAIIHQESRFVHNAKPPRRKILWVIPGPRLSDAYGYAQAKDSTWEWYIKDSGRWGANRRDFGDAADFVGWYNHKSKVYDKIAPDDPYNLYLAYHDGHGGYLRKTYAKKAWLLNVAKRVAQRAERYQTQLQGCEADLQRRSWWPF